VVIGAESGVGKSEIAYNIAITNAQRNKKVLLLSLE
jgi:Mrp family chromosome partitioning ATPase